MAIDITIKAGMLHRKPLPLDVILGEELHYGSFENDNLILDELGDGWFIAYHPAHIGRGISVTWQEGERSQVELRLPMPSTAAEITDLFQMAARIAQFWQGRVEVDGTAVSLKALQKACADYIAFNPKAVQGMFEQIVAERRITTLYCAAWPLHLGSEDAAAFLADPHAYAAWLHEKQSVDAWHAGAVYSRTEEGVEGFFNYLNGLPAIFMREPEPPFGLTNPDTGKPLQVDCWVVGLNLGDWDHPIGQVAYADFLARLPEEKVHEYDAASILVDGLTAEEIQALLK